MPTIFTKGDIFNTPGIRAYAHGSNCAGAMDSGVSVAFKKRFPRMFDEYVARCADKRFRLGDVFHWFEPETEETVYTLAIQENWKAKAKLAAFHAALKKMVDLAHKERITQIGLPRIGAGLGGLDWLRVKAIVTEVGDTTDVGLVVFEQFVRETGK